MNKVQLMGRLTRDPELRVTQTSGTPVLNVGLAVDRRFARDGQQTVDFFDLVVWGKSAEAFATHLRKGRQIAVSGRLQQRSYETQDGAKRHVVEVVVEDWYFCGSKPEGASSTSNTAERQAVTVGGGSDSEDLPEDLPF